MVSASLASEFEVVNYLQGAQDLSMYLVKSIVIKRLPESAVQQCPTLIIIFSALLIYVNTATLTGFYFLILNNSQSHCFVKADISLRLDRFC